MFPMPGPFEMIVFGVIALLLFGKRLPEVARSLGKGIVEFKKGLNSVEEAVDTSSATYSRSEASNASRPTPAEERLETTAPKFEPPVAEPR